MQGTYPPELKSEFNTKGGEAMWDNMAWEDVAPYIRTAESGDKEMIIRENEAGLGFDLGPYQINTRWLFAGEGTFQKMAGTDALYKPWEEIDKLLMGDLSQEQMLLLPLGTTTYTGKKQGFDLTFKRMWEFYLSYCEAGFKSKNIDLIQFSLQNK